MRILILPTISKKEAVGFESCFILFYNFIKRMPQHYWYMVTSKSADVKDFILPHCHYLKIEDFAEYNYLHGVYPQTELGLLFNKMSGEYPIDCIVTTRSPIGALLKRNFRGGNKSNSYIPVLTIITKAMAPGATHDVVNDDDLMLRAVTYAQCPTMLFTEYERELALSTVKSLLLPSAYKMAMTNCRAIPQGMDVEYHAQCIDGVRKRPKFTLYWGGRFITNKRWEDIINIYRNLRVSLDCDIEITTPAGSSMGRDTSSYPDIDIHYGLSQREVFIKQAQCHAGMVYSHIEGLAIGFIEQIMSGLVMIFWKKKWSIELFRGLKYPFMFESEREAMAMLKWIKNNYEEAQKMMGPVKDWIRENYSLSSTSTRLNGLLEEITADTWVDIKSDKIISTMLRRMPKEFTFSRYVRDLIKTNPGYGMTLNSMYCQAGTRAELGRRDLYKWLCKYCDDLCNSPDPIFRKR